MKSAGHDGPPLYPGPLCGGESGSTGRAAGIDRDVDAFSLGQATHGEGMDARVEATQEQLPDAGVEATHGAVARCPIEKPDPDSRTCRAGARQAPSGVAFSVTSGILPFALRAGFAVRAAPAAQWLLISWPCIEISNSRAAGARKVCSHAGSTAPAGPLKNQIKSSPHPSPLPTGGREQAPMTLPAGEREQSAHDSPRRREGATRPMTTDR
jgi:hypothetical protein